MFSDSEGWVTWSGNIFCHCPVAPRLFSSVFDSSASLCQELPKTSRKFSRSQRQALGGVGRKDGGLVVCH